MPIAQATLARVTKAWKQLQADPCMFEVSESYTITVGDDVEPKIRSEVFDIWTTGIYTPAELIREVEGCTPLSSHFRNLALDRQSDLQVELGNPDLAPGQRKALQRLAKALDDQGNGWQALITTETLPEHVQVVRDWLNDPIEWDEMEYFPRDWGPQGKALSFFESLPFDTLDALGVEIIEGDHPGSTYYAAELRNDIDDANRVAAEMELPFRFRSA